MGVRQLILQWSKSQPTWRQDALRRLLGGALSEADEAEVLALLKAAHAVEKTELVAVPLAEIEAEEPSHSDKPIRLCKIYDVNHANRLAPDQTLAFAQSGVTLIYGDNGSGKSGYARILKRACSARAADDETEALCLMPDDSADQLKSECPTLHAFLPKFFETAVARYDAIVKSVVGDEDADLGTAPAIDTSAASARLSDLKTLYEAADAATKAEGAKVLRKEFEEMTSKQALHGNKQQVKKRLEALRHIKALEATIKACVTPTVIRGKQSYSVDERHGSTSSSPG